MKKKGKVAEGAPYQSPKYPTLPDGGRPLWRLRLAARLKSARLSKGLSQANLCALAVTDTMPPSFKENLFNGRNQITSLENVSYKGKQHHSLDRNIEVLEGCAKHTDVPIEWLLFGVVGEPCGMREAQLHGHRQRLELGAASKEEIKNVHRRRLKVAREPGGQGGQGGGEEDQGSAQPDGEVAKAAWFRQEEVEAAYKKSGRALRYIGSARYAGQPWKVEVTWERAVPSMLDISMSAPVISYSKTDWKRQWALTILLHTLVENADNPLWFSSYSPVAMAVLLHEEFFQVLRRLPPLSFRLPVTEVERWVNRKIAGG